MTVIAFRDGILAADSEIAQGTFRSGRFTKIIRTRKGLLAGGAGTVENIKRFHAWARAGLRKDKRPLMIDGDFEGMIIKPDGSVLHYEGGLEPFELDAPFHAWGTGGNAAVIAMEAGASAERACQIACKYVHGCSEPIVTLAL